MLTRTLCLAAMLFAGLTVAQLPAADSSRRVADLSWEEMASIIQFLGHDHLEGRAPGTRGGELAELYSQSLLAWMGLRPGWNGSFFQPFIMTAHTTESLTVHLGDLALPAPREVAGGITRDLEEFSVAGEAVFAGFGIRSEAYGWDDFKDVDVTGKFLIVRVNDPGSVDQGLFEGAEMTYFGRWRYKLEQAAAAGARGVLLVHTDASAGYGWHVVETSWSGERLSLPESVESSLEFTGWIQEGALRRVLAGHGMDLDTLYAASARPDFRPVPLPFAATARGRSRFRPVAARNVVAEIPGATPERIVLVAHIDHLGTRTTASGVEVFNGAIDNGSAVAAMMLAARTLKARPEPLRYTVTVLACHAEEAGLLGSAHYVATADRSEIVAGIAFESTPVWERSGSIMGVGARYSTLDDLLRRVAADMNVGYTEFSMKNQGFFYRSDQFSFARAGIPALWISAGEDFARGRNRLREFFLGDYHTPNDVFDPAWELESLRQTVLATVLLVEAIDAAPERPRWKRSLTFPLDP